MKKISILWINDGVYFEDKRFITPLLVDIETSVTAVSDIENALYHINYDEKFDIVIIGKRIIVSTNRCSERRKRKKDQTVWERAQFQNRPLRIEFIRYLLGTPDALEQIGENKKINPIQIVVYDYGFFVPEEKQVLTDLGIENFIILGVDESPLVFLEEIRKIAAKQSITS